MAIAKLMTNILPQYYVFLKAEAKREKKTIREVIEEAIVLYKKEKKKELIRQDCKRLGKDKKYLAEAVQMADEGIDYYLADIDKADKHNGNTEI